MKISLFNLIITSIAIVALGLGAQKGCWAFFRHTALSNPQEFKDFWEDLADEVAKNEAEGRELVETKQGLKWEDKK